VCVNVREFGLRRPSNPELFLYTSVPHVYIRALPPLPYAHSAIPRDRMPHGRLVSLGFLLLLSACGKDAPTVVDNTPASVTLSPSGPLSIASGSTTTVTATAAAKDGHAVSPSFTWTSGDQTIATVSGGVITAIKTGTTTITATASPASASVQVTVNPGPATQLAVRTQPVGAPIGTPLATQPVIEIPPAIW
jgi:Big-like domain-containing protein